MSKNCGGKSAPVFQHLQKNPFLHHPDEQRSNPPDTMTAAGAVLAFFEVVASSQICPLFFYRLQNYNLPPAPPTPLTHFNPPRYQIYSACHVRRLRIDLKSMLAACSARNDGNVAPPPGCVFCGGRLRGWRAPPVSEIKPVPGFRELYTDRGESRRDIAPCPQATH